MSPFPVPLTSIVATLVQPYGSGAWTMSWTLTSAFRLYWTGPLPVLIHSAPPVVAIGEYQPGLPVSNAQLGSLTLVVDWNLLSGKSALAARATNTITLKAVIACLTRELRFSSLLVIGCNKPVLGCLSASNLPRLCATNRTRRAANPQHSRSTTLAGSGTALMPAAPAVWP